MTTAAAAAVMTVYLVWLARPLYFFGDDWTFFLERTASDGIFEPHNEHWSTLPLLAYRIMYATFGIDHHLAYASMAIGLHIAVGGAVHGLLRANGHGPWPAAMATIVVLATAGNTAQNPLWSFQIGFLGSALFGTMALIFYRPRPLPVAAVWVVTVLSMACSGMAIPMLGWLVLYTLLRGGALKAVVVALPPLVVYGGWFLAFGRDARSPTDATWVERIAFAWTGITSVWESATGIPGIGAVVVVAAFATIWLFTAAGPARDLGLAGILAMASLYALLASSRAGFGTGFALNGRYTYFAILMTVPAFACVSSVLADGIRARRPELELRLVAATTMALIVVTGLAQAAAFSASRQETQTSFKSNTLGAVALLRQGEDTFDATIDPVANAPLTRDRLLMPGVLDSFPPVTMTPRLSVQATVSLQVTASDSSLGLAAAKRPRRSDITGPRIPTVGCAEVVVGDRGKITLLPRQRGQQVSLVVYGGSISVRAGTEAIRSDPVTLDFVPGRTLFVGSLSSRWPVQIRLPAGPAQLCGS